MTNRVCGLSLLDHLFHNFEAIGIALMDLICLDPLCSSQLLDLGTSAGLLWQAFITSLARCHREEGRRHTPVRT